MQISPCICSAVYTKFHLESVGKKQELFLVFEYLDDIDSDSKIEDKCSVRIIVPGSVLPIFKP